MLNNNIVDWSVSLQVGCLCPRNTVCELDIIYPAHPDTGDIFENKQETIYEFVTDHVLWLGVGVSVIGLLLFYILVIIFLIVKRRKAKQMAIAESVKDPDATTETFIHEERTRSSISPSSSPSSSTNSDSLIMPQPIISVSQLLAIHQNQSKSTNQRESSYLPEDDSLLPCPHPPGPPGAEYYSDIHESPLLNSIRQLSSSSSLSSCSISIAFSEDTEDAESDNSYDHLDHHRSINDVALNYCHWFWLCFQLTDADACMLNLETTQ